MKKLISAGATFIARTHAAHVTHMMQLIERAFDHQGFSVIECLSECVEFFPDVFDPANPKKGGSFEVIQEKEMGQHARGRAAARRHRRAGRVQTRVTPVPRRVRRLLRNRSPNEEFTGEEVD